MRADELFTNLNRRQSMMLLAAVSFGGAESLEALQHASAEDGDVLRERAAKLLSIPRDERIRFLVQEMKRRVAGRQGGDLRGASPEAVAAALEGERPALAEVLLRALPASLAEQVRNELPPNSVKLRREVRPELLAAIRWHFERKLAHLAPRERTFLFADIQSLPPKDLASLADHLGAQEVGWALASLPNPDREPWLRELTSDQRSQAVRGVAAYGSSRMDPAEARELLEAIAPPDPRYRVRHAGVRRIVRACLAESAESAGRLAERDRGELGRMVVAAIRSERAMGRAGAPARLQEEIVDSLEDLAARGIIERPVRLRPPAALQEKLGGKREKDTLPPLEERDARAVAVTPVAPPARTARAKEHPAVVLPQKSARRVSGPKKKPSRE